MGDANDATENDTEHDGTEHDGTEHDGIEHDATGAQTTASGDEVMDLLAEHVPLALLADLAAPDGPVSTEILASEGLPDDAWWETSDDVGTPPSADDPELAPDDGGEDFITA